MEFEIIPVEVLPKAVVVKAQRVSIKGSGHSRTRMRCFDCQAGLRKPNYVTNTYPSGHTEEVPLCNNCFRKRFM